MSGGGGLDRQAIATNRRFGTKFRLETREVRQTVLDVELDREEDFYTALDGGHDAMLCWGPSYECARSWLVRLSFRRLPSLVKLIEFGSLGTTTDCGSYWRTPLGVTDYGHGKLFLRMDY